MCQCLGGRVLVILYNYLKKPSMNSDLYRREDEDEKKKRLKNQTKVNAIKVGASLLILGFFVLFCGGGGEMLFGIFLMFCCFTQVLPLCFPTLSYSWGFL